MSLCWSDLAVLFYKKYSFVGSILQQPFFILSVDLGEKDLLMVPDTAVVLRDAQPVVFKVIEGQSAAALQVPVKTGTKSGGFTAITGEVAEEDSIVILGNAFLEDGQFIEVVERR